MLYKFEELSKKLDELGYPSIVPNTGFRLLKGIDFENAFKNKTISFENDGIYLNYEDKKYRGYMFIKEPHLSKYDGHRPKFHLTKCKTISDFMNNGTFKVRYEWANSEVIDLIDKSTRKEYKDEVLDLCSNCKKNIDTRIKTTKDFYNSLDKDRSVDENIEVDIFGDVKGKKNISKNYRSKKGFVCENCGIKSKNKMHNRYWYIYHKDGNKVNTKETNLECLCVLCYKVKCVVPFNTKNKQIEVNNFKHIYADSLVLLRK